MVMCQKAAVAVAVDRVVAPYFDKDRDCHILAVAAYSIRFAEVFAGLKTSVSAVLLLESARSARRASALGMAEGVVLA